MKIIFFGTSRFAAIILDQLIQHKSEIIAVVTKPDSAAGRYLEILPSPVKKLVNSLNLSIPLFQPVRASTAPFIESVSQLLPDLFLVASYGEIISRELLELPSLGAINVHPSLLPRYRGAAPIQRALMNGDRSIGVAIIKMSVRMDAGDILNSYSMMLDNRSNFGEVEEKLALYAVPSLIKVIEQLRFHSEEALSQDERLVSFAPKIEPEERKIDWSWPAERIHNLIRALAPTPSAWCWIVARGRRQRMKILRSFPIISEGRNPGESNSSSQEWIVATGDGAVQILEVQLEGKRVQNSIEFLRGFSHPFHLE